MTKPTRRKFVWPLILTVFLVAIPSQAGEKGRRPVLYNGDGGWYYYGYTNMPERLDRQYLEGIVNRLAAARVTIHSEVFYDGGRCWYDTKVGERFDKDYGYLGFSPETGQFTELFYWRMVANFRRLVSEGNEPLKVFIETAHKRGLKFLACLRMNDRHDIHVKNPPRPIRQHPEMTMKRKDGKVIGAMDFQHPEVRDFVFSPMQEMATNYDVDGLELDWMRWAQMFSEDVPKEKRMAILNDYHRRIRKMLDEVGKRKGKQLLLSVRVPATLEECETLGYDVATYIREGLIDILCPSDFLFLDPHMPVGDFARLTRGTKVILLPSLHASPGWNCGYAATENERALAHSYYQQGADGISVFNWFQLHEINLPENFAALEEAGDPAALVRLPREYLFNPIWGGRTSQTGRVIDWKAAVLRSSLDKREVFPLFMKEDFNNARATLRLKVENLTEEDELRIDVNGKPLDASHYRKRYLCVGKPEATRYFDAAWWAGPYYLFEVENAGHLLKDGANEVGLTLVRANSMLKKPITLFEVRVSVQPK